MSLARLDNEVFFKKAFTDPIVFRAFVKDIVGIEVNPEVIETEKGYHPRLGSIDFRYDIFAEDVAQRVIVEIQKVEYDHNFDRFLHYHLQGITEQQRSSEDYSVSRTVYTIVVMTAPYKTKAKTGEVYRDEVLISSINPKNLQGIERRYYDHELIFLNPNYKGADTPANYRDWLDLIYESIHHPDAPAINHQNLGIRRASELIQWENISPQEWEASKIEAGKRVVLSQTLDEGKHEKAVEVAQKLLAKGMPIPEISEITGLSESAILDLR